jgi:NhaP-type Na+/H+ and K+/H+ antiporter
LFYSFTVVLQLYCFSSALLLFSIFTAVLQLYFSSPALLLFCSFTTVAGEQLQSCTTVNLENSNKAEEQQQSWKTIVKM